MPYDLRRTNPFIIVSKWTYAKWIHTYTWASCSRYRLLTIVEVLLVNLYLNPLSYLMCSWCTIGSRFLPPWPHPPPGGYTEDIFKDTIPKVTLPPTRNEPLPMINLTTGAYIWTTNTTIKVNGGPEYESICTSSDSYPVSLPPFLFSKFFSIFHSQYLTAAAPLHAQESMTLSVNDVFYSPCARSLPSSSGISSRAMRGWDHASK